MDKFRIWLAANKIKSKDAAKEFGVSNSHFSNVLNSALPPSRTFAKNIVKFTGGKVDYNDIYGIDSE